MSHEHHRQRIRERFLKNGFDGFSNYELLEVLLFAAHPRGNTNQYAHALLDRFGSLSDILRASPEVLKTVPGIGDSAVMSIKIISELIRRMQEEANRPEVFYDTVSKLVGLLRSKFCGLAEEHVYLLLFDNRMKLLDTTLISKGTVSSADLSIPKIVNAAVIRQAPNVVIAHNHPVGIAIASENDKLVTECLYSTLASAGIRLVEHVICTETDCFPIIYRDCRDLRSIPIRTQVECTFLEDFYDVDFREYKFPTVYEELLAALEP